MDATQYVQNPKQPDYWNSNQNNQIIEDWIHSFMYTRHLDG